MAVIGGEQLRKLLSDATPLEDRLVVTPILEPEVQIGQSSVDVRLGSQFIVTKTSQVGGVEPYRGVTPTDVEQYQETLHVGFNEPLWIHPGTFVLGATLEYLKLPGHLYANVTARSSWARLGLSIASAVAVHPGFYGCLTLELVNNGNTPVAIHPGDRIGQLTVYVVEGDEVPSVEGKYLGSIAPGYSRLPTEEDERRRWEKVGKAMQSVPRKK